MELGGGFPVFVVACEHHQDICHSNNKKLSLITTTTPRNKKKPTKVCVQRIIIIYAVLPHRTFFKVLYFFFTISRFCTFFVLFSGLVLFLYFFCINLAEFYQILFKSYCFCTFFWRFCEMNVLLIYNLQGFLHKYPIECLRLQEIGVDF